MRIKGNIKGIKKYVLSELENLYALPAIGRTCISEEIAACMLAFTHKYNREIAVCLDIKGKVREIIIGDFASVQLDTEQEQNGKIRCIHTHPKGSGALSEADITAFLKNGFHAMACMALNKDGDFKRGGRNIFF